MVVVVMWLSKRDLTIKVRGLKPYILSLPKHLLNTIYLRANIRLVASRSQKVKLLPKVSLRVASREKKIKNKYSKQ